MSSQPVAVAPITLKSIKLSRPVALPVAQVGDFEIKIGWQSVKGQHIPVGMPEDMWRAELERREEQQAKTYARFVGRKIAWHIEYWRRRGRDQESVASLFEYITFNQPNLFAKRYLVAPRYYKATLKYVEALLVQAAQKRRVEDRLRMEVRRAYR